MIKPTYTIYYYMPGDHQGDPPLEENVMGYPNGKQDALREARAMRNRGLRVVELWEDNQLIMNEDQLDEDYRLHRSQ
jgi:hypothetical protein